MGLNNFILTCKKDNEELRKDINYYKNMTSRLKKENQELKSQLKVPENCNLKTLEDYKSYYEDTTREQILEDSYIDYCAYVNSAHRYSKLEKQLENYKKLGFKHLQDKNNDLETQQKGFIKYLEDELDRLARECSQIYEDSLGKTRLVNEDIFNEANKILSKYKSIIGDDK